MLGEVAVSCWVWWLLGFVILVVAASKIVGLRRERERQRGRIKKIIKNE